MTQTVETKKEQSLREGRDFLFLGSSSALAAGATADFVVCVSSHTHIDSIIISSDSEELTWQPFIGTVITDGTGTEISPIPRNPIAATKSNCTMYVDPTITSIGQALTSLPVQIVAQIGAGNRAFIDKDLLSTALGLVGGQCYLVRITNLDSSAVKYSISFDIVNEKD